MVARIVALVFAALALSAGVTFAATQLASLDGTQVCVNNTTGLMRVASTCRVGEHALTIGGGGVVRVTQNGTLRCRSVRPARERHSRSRASPFQAGARWLPLHLDLGPNSPWRVSSSRPRAGRRWMLSRQLSGRSQDKRYCWSR